MARRIGIAGPGRALQRAVDSISPVMLASLAGVEVSLDRPRLDTWPFHHGRHP